MLDQTALAKNVLQEVENSDEELQAINDIMGAFAFDTLLLDSINQNSTSCWATRLWILRKMDVLQPFHMNKHFSNDKYFSTGTGRDQEEKKEDELMIMEHNGPL